MADVIKQIFCANEQKETAHQGVIDSNGEFVFYCKSDGCDRFVKFPADVTQEQFNELLAKHQEQNQGQISVAAQEEKLATLVGQSEETQEEQPTPEAPQEAKSVE